MTAAEARLGQLSLAPSAVAGVHEISMAEGNELLTRWGHYLGPCNRPFGQQAFALCVGSQPVSVAVSASAVSSRIPIRYEDRIPVEWLDRRALVELARLCSGEPWATRVMLRLWREVCAPAWPYWQASAAVAYSQNERHEGRIYRFDGWERITDAAGGSGGGGGWSSATKGRASAGRKTLWLWRFPRNDGEA